MCSGFIKSSHPFKAAHSLNPLFLENFVGWISASAYPPLYLDSYLLKDQNPRLIIGRMVMKTYPPLGLKLAS